MQHTKTPNQKLAALRTERSVIVARLVADSRIFDELSQHRNRINKAELADVNARILKVRA